MIGTLPMALGNIGKNTPIGFCAEMPEVFSCLEEARNSFDFHWNGCVRMFNALGDPPDIEMLAECRGTRNAFLEVFKVWEKAFERYLQQKWNDLDGKSQSGARVLQMMVIHAFCHLDSCLYNVNQETIWDRYLPQYKRQVELAEAILKNNAHSSPYFCLEMNFVAPLYVVASKCRDPIVRRKALSLLYSSPRQEGIWDSIMTARVAQRLISIEEDGLEKVTCCEDVPDWARLSYVEVNFDYQGRLGTVKYARMTQPQENTKRQSFTEVISW